jgi:hypothetical protein
MPFWTWSNEDAAGLAAALTTRGFRILAQRPGTSSNDPSLWNAEAGIQQSIELTLRREFTDELVRVAAAHSGRYDGWALMFRFWKNRLDSVSMKSGALQSIMGRLAVRESTNVTVQAVEVDGHTNANLLD